MTDKEITHIKELQNYDMKVYGLIPVKAHSTRFIGKNFSEFCGTTLINNTIDKLVKARVDKIYISTDIPIRVKQVARAPPVGFNELYIIERPNELATPEATQDNVVLNFINQLDEKENYIIVLCQVTSPNWSHHRLSYAIHKMLHKHKTTISVSENLQPNGCFYIFTKEMFLEYQRIYHGIYLIVLPWEESTDIDYPYQISIAEAIERGDYDEY